MKVVQKAHAHVFSALLSGSNNHLSEKPKICLVVHVYGRLTQV